MKPRRVKHKDRVAYPTKATATAAARKAQRLTWRIYRVWPCARCGGQRHIASWAELVREARP